MIEIFQQHGGYLAGGFAMNLLISALSMLLGTLFGAVLGLMRFRRLRAVEPVARLGTNICRNVPSFVLLFYMASMIPSEVEIGGAIVAVPLWIKATLALIFPVTGFVSDQFLGFLEQRRSGTSRAGETFFVAWVQYLLIIVMASATASVIGADEIVGRANTLISRNVGSDFLLSVYLFVSLWFLVTGLIVSGLLRGAMRLSRR
ncbi:ABC transporter permease subunit [Sulfitobacter sp. D35]|uniref:ABC transporter permease subunit n=1 Tax=Sulfitobacter sp. D35 TaxID=3083252 RepID=UPI00296F8D08|nr:ABC transporter permease subunit [Sulfitobacter sp. D35]MDW4497080.1 ABC transporter permease subunit [Sulfitobacter sp. D35]